MLHKIEKYRSKYHFLQNGGCNMQVDSDIMIQIMIRITELMKNKIITNEKIADGMCIVHFLNIVYKCAVNIIFGNPKIFPTKDRILQKLPDINKKIMFFFDNILHKYRTIYSCSGHELSEQFVSLKYEDRSKLWTSWSRKARGSIFYLDLDTNEFIILKELLDRGAEVLTKSQHVDETETYKIGDEKNNIFTPIQNETIQLLNDNTPFIGSLSMKVDGSLCSINIYPKNSKEAILLKKFIDLEIIALNNTECTKIGDVERKKNTYYFANMLYELSRTHMKNHVMIISSHNTMFADIVTLEWIISSILGGFFKIPWNILETLVKNNKPNKENLKLLITNHIPEFVSNVEHFCNILIKKNIINITTNCSLIFEAVCPFKKDLFGNNQTESLAVSYDKAMFQFLGINYEYGKYSGTFLPHSNDKIQEAIQEIQSISKYKNIFNDPLCWYKVPITQKLIDDMLFDLENVLLEKMSIKQYIEKYEPSNLRQLEKNEILDFEGFILYRIVDNYYDYNKVKQHLYYKLHKIHEQNIDELLQLPLSVSKIYPKLKKIKIVKYTLVLIKENIHDFITFIDTTFDSITLNDLVTALTHQQQELYNKLNGKKIPQRINIINWMKVAKFDTQNYLTKLNNLILDTFDMFLKKYGIELIYNEKIKKELILLKLFDIYINYIKNESYIEILDDLLLLIFEISEPIITDLHINIMSWNITSNVMYSSDNDYRNVHGFDINGLTINDQIRMERMERIKKIILERKPDILLLQEVNGTTLINKTVKWYEEIYNENYKLIRNDNIGYSCYHRKNKSTGEYLLDNNKRIITKALHGSIIMYNPKKLIPLKSEVGCLMKDDDWSGSGYNFMLLVDPNDKRFFVISLHIKILDWNDKNLKITMIADELLIYFENFINSIIPQINTNDILIIGGDFNAGTNLLNKTEIRYYSEFVNALKNAFANKFELAEIDVKYITQQQCIDEIDGHVDHILTNATFVTYSEEKLPLLATGCPYGTNFDVLDKMEKKNQLYEKFSNPQRTYQLTLQNRKLLSTKTDLSDHRPVRCKLLYKGYNFEFPTKNILTTSNPIQKLLPIDKSKKNIVIMYPISIPGVGKNYLFDSDNFKQYILNIGYEYISLERDSIPKGTYNNEVVKILMDRNQQSDNLVLILNRNFDPSSLVFKDGFLSIKEFTTPVQYKNKNKKKIISINDAIKEVNKDFNIYNVGLDFRDDVDKFSINAKCVSLFNIFKRHEHKTNIDVKHPYESLMTAKMFWDNWNKGLDQYTQTYFEIIKIKWLKENIQIPPYFVNIITKFSNLHINPKNDNTNIFISTKLLSQQEYDNFIDILKNEESLNYMNNISERNYLIFTFSPFFDRIK